MKLIVNNNVNDKEKKEYKMFPFSMEGYKRRRKVDLGRERPGAQRGRVVMAHGPHYH